MNNHTLTPRRPHILRAFYDWLVENELTPHLVVDATLPMVDVPQDYVKDGQIVLNVSLRAAPDFTIENHQVSFNASFGGQSMLIVVPMYAAMAIYARENGAGTMFEPEPSYDSQLEELTKSVASSVAAIGLVEETEPSESADDVEQGSKAEQESKKSTKGKKGPPTLTVVK